ncbi:MAG TPA: hypothetical protein VMG82_03100 [Candidatus Sulfotelmatobacter sp.]|nr:hypothetical protein [Candidatus Sulfotelmatobacter sp.]
MATISKVNTTLTVRAGSDRFAVVLPILGRIELPGVPPSVTPDAGPWVGFDFNSPTIDAFGSIRLTGTAGESVAGWTLGFIQLKYIGTNYARYRGATDRDGSILITGSNQVVCRDTDIGSVEVWYDSLNSGGTTGPNGTNKLPAGTIIPATGFLDVPAHLFDQPSRTWQSIVKNTSVPGHPNNFLHHADIGLAFCTMLVARDPANKFHMLMHFYWNVRWEQMFAVDGTGKVVAGRTVHLQHNIQRPVHTGNPMDRRFHGKEFDLSLPVSNTVSRQPHRVHPAADWRHT